MKEFQFEYFRTLLDEVKPKFLGELGSHKGRTSEQICKHLIKYTNDFITFYGYDVFEDVEGNKEFAVAEHNGKGAGSYYETQKRLLRLKESNFKRFEFRLFKGLTSETLTKPVKFDFVYIDAGHSYESVLHDWNMVKESKMIVFDDCDLEGIKRVIDEHVRPNHKVEITKDFRKQRALAIVRNF
jgi:hypothetical protein